MPFLTDIVSAEVPDSQAPEVSLVGPKPMIVTSDPTLVRLAVCNGLRNALEAVAPAVPDEPDPIVITWGENTVLIRHGTAMHLLQSGVDITVIALWLGHEDVQTTHVYLQADLAMKEKALNKLAPPETKVARFKPCDEVLAFLASL